MLDTYLLGIYELDEIKYFNYNYNNHYFVYNKMSKDELIYIKKYIKKYIK